MNERRATFYYDADCGMCAGVVRFLRRFDARGRVAWTAVQSLDAPPEGLTWEDLERSAWLSRGGEWREGFYAIRELLGLLPALAAVGGLMRLPGVRFVGVPAYRLVADNRYRISGCRVSGGAARLDSDSRNFQGRD